MRLNAERIHKPEDTARWSVIDLTEPTRPTVHTQTGPTAPVIRLEPLQFMDRRSSAATIRPQIGAQHRPFPADLLEEEPEPLRRAERA